MLDEIINIFDISYNHESMTYILSKILGYFLILLAMFAKTPQIIKILKNKSWDGILISMFYFEEFMNTNRILYFYHYGFSFSLYGDIWMLSIQDYIIIFLCWKYRDDITFKSKIRNVSILLVYVIFLNCFPYIPEYTWNILISSTLMWNILSRGPQVVYNFQNKSTGQLSFQTYFINSFRNIARIYTLFRENPDINNLIYNGISLVLHMSLTLQIVYYKYFPSGLNQKLKTQ